MRKLLLATILSTLTINAQAKDTFNLNAKVISEQNCRMNHKCDLKGVFDVEITNDSNEDHTYYWSYSVCGDQDVYRQCAMKTGTTTVLHNNYYKTHYEITGKKVFSWAGLHHIDAGIGYSNTAFGLAEKVDRKDIEVND